MATRVKICGICDVASGIGAVEAGADLIGFHFCSSPRQITPEQARRIIDALPRRPVLVGVFIDPTRQAVDEIAQQCDLDLVQLHGDEPVGFSCDRPLMKVLKVRDGRIPSASGWPDPIMLDAWSADGRGGTGRSWDWELARPLMEQRQVFIAGGLDTSKAEQVVRRYRPYGVDVSSGVESQLRVKDPTLMKAFVQAVRRADEQG
jgi:phosphoribosylanthranilate isomerase